jgi:hypothetical protein
MYSVGAEPSIVCDDASAEKPNCSCTCTNGITFDQPLDPFHSPSSGAADDTVCQAEKTECQAEKTECQAEKTECQAEKAECQAEKAECQAEKTECQAEKTECLAREQTSLSELKTLKDQLAAYKNAPAYVYLGCFWDFKPRVLNSKDTYDGAMTVQKCEAFCKGYKYYGLQQSSYCFCGNSFAVNTKSRPESDCSSNCSGNNRQKRGATAANSLYARKS